MRALAICIACVLLSVPCAAAPADENAAALSKAEQAQATGDRYEDRWRGRKHILYDEVVQEGTDGAAEIRENCRSVSLRYKRPDGSTAVRRENRCE